MKIQVIGSGCTACKKLFEITKAVAAQLNLNAQVEYSTDISRIIEMGVMSSPVLAIDGKPVLVGLASDSEKIKKLLSDTASADNFSGKKSDGCCDGAADSTTKNNSPCRCKGNC